MAITASIYHSLETFMIQFFKQKQYKLHISCIYICTVHSGMKLHIKYKKAKICAFMYHLVYFFYFYQPTNMSTMA